mgnify:CR=1 FL=1
MSAVPAAVRMKLYIKTMGCQMNEYDSAKMADVLAASHGYTRTQNPDEADLLLLNTCSIREKAQEKVFSQLGRWRLLKENRFRTDGREVIIGVGGCVASQEGEAIIRRAPYVDLVFGLLSPENAGATHLHALAAISRLVREEGMHEAMNKAPDAEALYALVSNVSARDAA